MIIKSLCTQECSTSFDRIFKTHSLCCIHRSGIEFPKVIKMVLLKYHSNSFGGVGNEKKEASVSQGGTGPLREASAPANGQLTPN